MARFNNILVVASPGQLDPVDVEQLLDVAAADGASVTVLDVVEPLPARRRTAQVEGTTVDLQELLLRDRCEQLHATMVGASSHDIMVKVGTGTPVVEAVRHVREFGHDLVVVESPSPEEGSGLEASVAQLLRKCPAPVWKLRPGRAPVQSVIALVDPDDDDREGLNDRVLELATSLVPDGGELHVAHAWRLQGESTLRTSAFVRLPPDEVDAMVEETAAEHRAWVEELVARHEVEAKGGRVHVVEGEATAVLPRLVERFSGDLVVMGTVGRTGLSGLIMGNTAETVLRSVRSSVLTVKPDSFTSPVRPGPPSDVITP